MQIYIIVLEEFYNTNPKKISLYSNALDNLLPLNENNREHYTNYYKQRNAEVRNFFESFGKDRIIILQLDDKDKWLKIGSFFNLDVKSDYSVHANKSK